jgi:hypothetical protein
MTLFGKLTKAKKKIWECGSSGRAIPNKHGAQGSKSSTAKKENKKEKEKKTETHSNVIEIH